MDEIVAASSFTFNKRKKLEPGIFGRFSLTKGVFMLVYPNEVVCDLVENTLQSTSSTGVTINNYNRRSILVQFNRYQ